MCNKREEINFIGYGEQPKRIVWSEIKNFKIKLHTHTQKEGELGQCDKVAWYLKANLKRYKQLNDSPKKKGNLTFLRHTLV